MSFALYEDSVVCATNEPAFQTACGLPAGSNFDSGVRGRNGRNSCCSTALNTIRTVYQSGVTSQTQNSLPEQVFSGFGGTHPNLDPVDFDGAQDLV